VSASPSGARGPASRTLIVLLLIGAAIAALLPAVLARSPRVQVMRTGLTEVLEECRVRYNGARSAADTAAADAWRPALHGEQRPGDPPCGPYRRRNMLAPASR
jgi:type II secretory pathway pseudopilin PulG